MNRVSTKPGEDSRPNILLRTDRSFWLIVWVQPEADIQQWGELRLLDESRTTAVSVPNTDVAFVTPHSEPVNTVGEWTSVLVYVGLLRAIFTKAPKG